jgi:hypothetical protein
MTAHVRGSCRSLPVVVILLSLFFDACSRALERPVQQPTAPLLRQLWISPDDIASRDLLLGAGGRHFLPSENTYTFVAHKRAGTNKGYDVRDSRGDRWSVKLGDEVQPEVTASRILWALGFHQPPVYRVERWRLSGGDVTEQPPARFRAESTRHEVVGEWSWYHNPFIGTQPFAALVTVNALLNNWDLKTPNNKIYAVSDGERGTERRYVVRDLGGSLGKARQPRVLAWFPFMRQMQGTKNDLADFEAQGFVRGLNDGRVQFDYRGLDAALLRSVTIDDLEWTCALLSRLSENQWMDAFRAGGYPPDRASRYVRKIGAKIDAARQLVNGRAAAGRPDSVAASLTLAPWQSD